MAEDLGLVQLEGEAGPSPKPALAPPPPQERSPQQLAGRGVVTTPNRLKRMAPAAATQLETRGADGRRRINPVMVGGAGGALGPVPFGTSLAHGKERAPRGFPEA